MGVKERILATALRLYNEHGINAITTRDIAKDLEMSSGNLHYHFRYTKDIIKALYNEYVIEIELHLTKADQQQVVDLAYLFDLIRACFDIIYKYRFGFVNTGDIGFMVPEIREINNLLRARRRSQMNVLLNKLIHSGYLRDDLPEDIWDAFKTQLFILTDSYLSYNQTDQQHDEESAKAEFYLLYERLFVAYLVPQK